MRTIKGNFNIGYTNRRMHILKSTILGPENLYSPQYDTSSTKLLDPAAEDQNISHVYCKKNGTEFTVGDNSRL